MDTAKRQVDVHGTGRAKGAPRDVYDPHFPTRQRIAEASDRKRTGVFDPHFPQPKRN